MIWTEERELRLSQLWASKELSAAQIAADLGCFDHCKDGGRSAILGKVMRMGLPLRKGAKSEEERAQAKADREERRRERQRKLYAAAAEKAALEQQAPANIFTEILLQVEDAAKDPETAVSFDELREFSHRRSNQCRFIVNDKPASYLYCGAVTAPGESWCPSCRDIVMAKDGPILSDEERFRRAVAFKKNALSRSVTSAPAERDEAA